MGGVDAHVRQHLYALYAMWREGLGSPLAYPSVVCPLPHARSRAALSCMCDAVLVGLMLTHSCHDALTLARHATATHAGRLLARS